MKMICTIYKKLQDKIDELTNERAALLSVQDRLQNELNTTKEELEKLKSNENLLKKPFLKRIAELEQDVKRLEDEVLRGNADKEKLQEALTEEIEKNNVLENELDDAEKKNKENEV